MVKQWEAGQGPGNEAGYHATYIHRVQFVAMTTTDYLWPQFTPNLHNTKATDVCVQYCTMTVFIATHGITLSPEQ